MVRLLGCSRPAIHLFLCGFLVVSCLGDKQQQLDELQSEQLQEDQQGLQNQQEQLEEIQENFNESENVSENFSDQQNLVETNNVNSNNSIQNNNTEQSFGEFEENSGANVNEAFGNEDVGFENNAAAIEPGAGQATTTAEQAVAAAEVDHSAGGVFSGLGGVAAAAGLPEMGSKLVYLVEEKDTLGKISRAIFGSSSHWRKLAEWSGIADPNRIYPGDIVYYQLTEQTLAFASTYEQHEKVEITVKRGDTLGTLAQVVFGSTDLWQSVWRQNSQIVHPDQLEVGMKLLFKVDAGARSYLKNLTTKRKMAEINKIDALYTQLKS